jgi:hypothetical protein
MSLSFGHQQQQIGMCPSLYQPAAGALTAGPPGLRWRLAQLPLCDRHRQFERSDVG